MEPNILLIGKNLDTLEILKDELIKFNRKIKIANTKEMITSSLTNENIDLIIVGAGLPDNVKDSMLKLIEDNFPTIENHVMVRVLGITPVSMISYTNEKAVMWRLKNSRKLK